MSPERYSSVWCGPAWYEDELDRPYKITRHGKDRTEVMAYSQEKHRAMRLAMALQASEGGDVSVVNMNTDTTVFYIRED